MLFFILILFHLSIFICSQNLVDQNVIRLIWEVTNHRIINLSLQVHRFIFRIHSVFRVSRSIFELIVLFFFTITLAISLIFRVTIFSFTTIVFFCLILIWSFFCLTLIWSFLPLLLQIFSFIPLILSFLLITPILFVLLLISFWQFFMLLPFLSFTSLFCRNCPDLTKLHLYQGSQRFPVCYLCEKELDFHIVPEVIDQILIFKNLFELKVMDLSW